MRHHTMKQETITPMSATIDELTKRILALIPQHPNIMDIKNGWDLFFISDFHCEDIQPSLGQAFCALERAKRIARTASKETTP